VYRQDYSLHRQLPENLQILDAISQNFYWSWAAGGSDIFRGLDTHLWETCEQNPRRMLREIDDLSLWQMANQPAYVERLNSFASEFNNYTAAEPGFGSITRENPVAYFCAEYGVHNSLPVYSGGLGILAGDHLKSASDMNVPLVAVGLLYRFGFFR